MPNSNLRFTGSVCNSASTLCFAVHNSDQRGHSTRSGRWNYLVSQTGLRKNDECSGKIVTNIMKLYGMGIYNLMNIGH